MKANLVELFEIQRKAQESSNLTRVFMAAIFGALVGWALGGARVPDLEKAVARYESECVCDSDIGR